MLKNAVEPNARDVVAIADLLDECPTMAIQSKQIVQPAPQFWQIDRAA